MISREEATFTLKKTWRTEELKFYAEFFRPKNTDGSVIKPRSGIAAFGFFRNLSVNDRKIFYPPNESLKYERSVTFKVDVEERLEDGKYYYLELELDDDENRKENPYALRIKNIFSLEEDHLSPKEFIKQWFYKKGHTPGDAATIAGQLTLNELELYTHTKRFIFELIQNADDMPDGKKDVMIEINLLPNHLLFLHNGKYFDREDVKAISDAAKSTKSKNFTQTGYKGIGFKSVFTDSTRVYIKSGDYLFKFDKLEPIYNDFNLLYKGYTDSLTSKARKEFETEYRGKELEYTAIDKIPWQIKPIWVEADSISQELSSSVFMQHRQVSIALEIGENILQQKDYNGMILGLLKEPRFLLFLRNTKFFKFTKIRDQLNETVLDISVKRNNNIISVFSNENLIASYIKHEFTISINNEDFNISGLNFQKREIEGGKIEFIDNDGHKLENIPEKLGRLDKTIITLSAKIDKYLIENLKKEDSILFNYLPTSDQRFGFPFLVNADFVSKTDRELIQIENKWNHYLFYHLGQKCIEWLNLLANVKHEFNGKLLFSYAKTYLNLLPEVLLDENNEELSSINIAFNKGLTDAIQDCSFIIDNNGILKKCNDIIIDETLISKVLGNGFFKEVTKTEKELPFFLIDTECLKKQYLNIERYVAASLIKQLDDEINQKLLVKTLTRLKSDKYFEFLKWLDSFCKDNEVEDEFVLNLPIIRFNESILSLSNALQNNDFFLRIAKTIDLESILKKAGFVLSEFNLDEDIQKHIKGIILQQESYLKSDVGLYEHIASAKDLGKLSASEKNVLIAFFEGLDEVGKAKYAKSLALFKSKNFTGSLKPLNSLISNSCDGLPNWLTAFVIDGVEEKALAKNFQDLLLRETDLLEKLFCKEEVYKEIVAHVNLDNIESFYTYISKLLKDNTKETKIDFSGIPWVYIESKSSFAVASTIFWPESITKLTASKYSSVKSIIETISNDKMPHYSALQIKAPLALGSKDLKLSEIIPNENGFEVLAVNDFLDWAQTNGEEAFLIQFSLSKINDKYTITKSNDTLQYYTTDESLIIFIKASSLKTKLCLIPKELYTKERLKIGLLEGVSLLKYMIENGITTAAFSKYIQDTNDAPLTLQYLEVLEELKIDTSQTYKLGSDEFRILKLAIQYIGSEKEKLKNFRGRITIDGHQLMERAISEDIFFYDKNIGLKTKLSELLPVYKDRTFPLSEIIARFEGFDDNKNLAAILKDEGRTPKKILKELCDSKVSYYDPVQTFFLSFYQDKYQEEQVLKDKILFTAYNSTNQVQFKKEIHKFLDICLKENSYTGFLAQGIIPLFNPTNLVSNVDYSINVEQLPQWLSEWVNATDIENRKAFIKAMGINDDNSPVVLYRKALKEAQADPMNVNRELISNNSLLINTLTWLSNFKKSSNFIIKKEILQPLYQKLQNRKVTVENLLFPFLTKLTEDNYTLAAIEAGEELHYINQGWNDYRQDIFSHLVSTIRITDDVLPKLYRDSWKMIEKSFVKQPDIDKLASNSTPFNEEYYQEWSLKVKCNIQIYKGQQLPYLIKYNDLLIKNVTEKYADFINQIYYVVESKSDSILYQLEGVMPETTLNALRIHKQTLIEREKEAEKKVQFTEEESALWRKFFGDEIPKAYYQDINLAACVSALVILDKTDYNVANAEVNLSNTHLFAQISPVYKNEFSPSLTIMCRSAIGGILYLTAQAWDRLDNNDIYLFVKTGRKEDNYHLFQSKKEVLAVSNTKYQVFRVEAESNSSITDEILRGEFSKDKIWLILKMKESETYKSIFDGSIKRNEDIPDYEHISVSEDSPY